MYAYTPKNFKRRSFIPQQQRFSRNTQNIGKKLIWAIAGFALFVIFSFFIYIQVRVLGDLPDVSKIKNMTMIESTVITDRNGQELYKIFDENRQYIDLKDISKHMINAIVAVEDQRFWDHEGLDPMGIFRAWFKTMIGKNGWGGSTITQQLITNVMKLERPFGWSFLQKVDYKLKQIVLAKRLNNVLQKQIKAENKNLTNEQVKHEMKNKVLELYLNYVFLGNNAYGVQAASKTYFGKGAKDLTVLESAILASIPKAPTRYDPYKSTSLLGSFKITDGNKKEYAFDGNLKSLILSKYRENLIQADFSNKKSSEAFVKFVIGLCPSSVTLDGKEYYVKYENGRAEFALGRMYEDGKISEKELKSAFFETFTKTFEKSAFDIRAPHFVFWIKDLLEKEYGTWITKEGGLIVKTSLDYEIQKLAEAALSNNKAAFFENGATNGSMLYLDSHNGDVLAYVGSLDYFNKDIQGQNDMVRSPRQSGSSIKPLIYALGFDKLPLTIDTPIYDIFFKAGKDTPNNADGKFDGMLPLKKALWFSRNIPAVKMFCAVGGEAVVKPDLQSLGLSGIKNTIEYWYPLSLGAGEVSMIELAGAYSNLSTSTPGEINPILEIKASDGKILYTKEVKTKQNIIKPGIISLMWKILADPNNRIGVWVSKFNVKGLTYALKTWTSDVKTEKGGRPRDWWLAAYTPSRVIMMWAGNANATPMNRNAYGGTIHANSIKTFLSSLLANNYLSNEEMPNKDTAGISISKISGKLPGETTPANLVIQTLWRNGRLPKEIESPITEIEIDTSCYGKASPLTPIEQLKKGFLVQASTFMPNKMDLEDIRNYWKQQMWSWVQHTFNLFFEEPQSFCENRQPSLNDSIAITILKPQANGNFAKKNVISFNVKSPTAIKKINITLDGNTVKSFIENSAEIFASKDIDLSNYPNGNHTLGITVIDEMNATKTTTVPVKLVSEDKTPPLLRKDQSSVSRTEDGKYEVNLLFDDDTSWVKWGKIIETSWWKVVNTFKLQATSFTVNVPNLRLEVEDFYGNVLKQELNLDSL